MKATEQYFPVVLFIVLYKVVLTFESVDEILKCDHRSESYWTVVSCGAVYYAAEGSPNCWVCDCDHLDNTLIVLQILCLLPEVRPMKLLWITARVTW